MPRIKKIEDSKHKQERVLLFLDDGQLLKITKTELMRFGIQVGMEISEELRERLKESSQKSELRTQAAQMASRRILSKKEITQRLQKKGAQKEDAQEMADWLEDLGAVNDEVYADVIVRHYASLGYGPGRIRQEFIKRGIERDLWENALSHIPNQSESIDQFIEKKISGKDVSKDEMRKISNALLRRGFSWEDIRQAFQRLGKTEIEEDI